MCYSWQVKIPTINMKTCLCLLLLFSLFSQVHAAPGDDRFLAAREAFRTGDRVHLANEYNGMATSAATAAYDLDPWIEYWYLRQRLDSSNSVNNANNVSDINMAAVSDFLKRQSGTYLAERLRGDWLRSMGKQRRWDIFSTEYPQLKQPDTELNCYAVQARMSVSSPPQNPRDPLLVPDEVRPLWFTVLDMPEGCKPLMSRLIEVGKLDIDDVWDRIRLLLENKRYNGARQVADFLPDTQIPALKQLEAIADKPQRYLEKQLSAHFSGTRQGRELALFALQRLARIEPALAAVQMRRLQEKFSESERSYAWGQIAWQGALRHQPEALNWYGLATQGKDIRLNDAQRAWQVRAALRARDWPRVQQAIMQMPVTQRDRPDWTY